MFLRIVRLIILFLICYNIVLYLKGEILLRQLGGIITSICVFLVWPTLRKRIFCVRCCIIKRK